MPINFDLAEKIGSSPTDVPPSKRKVGYFEVLNSNKVPFEGVSLSEKGYYECPFCREYALKQVINWRCEKCSSKLIKWRCYTEETGQQHEHYDHYIKSFYANVEIRKDKMKMKKKKNE